MGRFRLSLGKLAALTALWMLVAWPAIALAASGHAGSPEAAFPPTLDGYGDASLGGCTRI